MRLISRQRKGGPFKLFQFEIVFSWTYMPCLANNDMFRTRKYRQYWYIIPISLAFVCSCCHDEYLIGFVPSLAPITKSIL